MTFPGANTAGPWPAQPDQRLPAQVPVGAFPPGTAMCRYCDSVPAVDVRFRRTGGFLFSWTMGTTRGPFCRDCGIATFRTTTAATFVLAWWSVTSIAISLVTLPLNLLAWLTVRDLAPPQFTARGRRRLPTGRPLYQRWELIGLVIPAAVAALIFVAIVSSVTQHANS